MKSTTEIIWFLFCSSPAGAKPHTANKISDYRSRHVYLYKRENPVRRGEAMVTELKKKVDYYVGLPYTMTIEYCEEQGGYYVASYIELPDFTMTG
jgi:hypothetical protein